MMKNAPDMWQKEFARVLQKQLEQRRQKNPRYSIRAYAAYLQISHAALSQVLRGAQKWNLSTDRARTILDLLKLPSEEKNRLLILMGLPLRSARQKIKQEDSEILTDWLYVAVLCCHDLPPSERAVEKIAARLGKKPGEIKKVLTKLLEKGLLRKSEEGDLLERNPDHLDAGDGPPSEVIRTHHKNNLCLAISAVDAVAPQERDFSSLTFVGNMEMMEELRKEIRQFHDRVMSLMNYDNKKEEVFRLSVGFFPIRFNEQDIKI